MTTKTYTKRLGILRKKEGMSDTDFRRHWLDVHAALCVKLPGLRRYAINFVERGRFAHFDYDGFSELYFDDEEALIAALNSPEGKTLLADLPNFTSHVAPILSVETTIIGS